MFETNPRGSMTRDGVYIDKPTKHRKSLRSIIDSFFFKSFSIRKSNIKKI